MMVKVKDPNATIVKDMGISQRIVHSLIKGNMEEEAVEREEFSATHVRSGDTLPRIAGMIPRMRANALAGTNPAKKLEQPGAHWTEIWSGALIGQRPRTREKLELFREWMDASLTCPPFLFLWPERVFLFLLLESEREKKVIYGAPTLYPSLGRLAVILLTSLFLSLFLVMQI